MARPKEFDPDQVLDKAMEVFWRKGYEATSIEDLVTRMGINRGSLYETFGDKQQLFLAAMDRYCKGTIADRLKQLEQPGPAVGTIKTFIRDMVRMALATRRKGCLIANTAMELAPHEKAIGDRVSCALGDLEEAFFKALQRAKANRELKRDQNPRALARYLTTMVQGVIVMYKAGTSTDALKDAVETALSVLD
ncbi:MAG TPA: TetR/AcrR family transcriptional regulator [Nitrospiraceae bacterium]|jgi:TetR/AcrR family transcriptional repressor of nem operon|nr:TetR/AcrR family transcriptional regulator [Nitrospiraceae bacterium]